MGEMLLSCCLYGEIWARRGGTALAVTSNTRCTQGYYKFDDFLPRAIALLNFYVEDCGSKYNNNDIINHVIFSLISNHLNILILII